MMRRMHRPYGIATAIFAFLGAGPVTGRAAEKYDFGVAFYATDNARNPEDYIPWQKVLFELKNNLGGALQLNYFVDVCYAGIAKFRSDPNAAGGIDLGMPYTMALGSTSPNATSARKTYFYAYSLPDPPPDGRPNADDNRRLKIGDYYYWDFDSYLTKKVKSSNATLTVKQLYDAAKADVLADPDMRAKGQTPDFVARRQGDENMRLNLGADRSRVLLFGGDTAGMHPETQFESYQALNAFGFDSMALYRHNRDRDLTANPPIQGKGTWQNFKSALGALKTQIADDDANQRHTVVNLFEIGHGTKEAKFDGRLGNQVTDPGPGEGYVLSGTGSVGIPMDTDFWNTLKVGLIPPPPDADDADKDLIRIHQPRFFLAYEDQSAVKPFSVSIGLSESDPGVSLGTFTIPTGAASGTLNVELDDAILSELISRYDGASRLVITYHMDDADWVRVGVLEDMLYSSSYLSYTYGTGIATVIAGNPEPATLALLSLGALTLLARRRRRSPQTR